MRAAVSSAQQPVPSWLGLRTTLAADEVEPGVDRARADLGQRRPERRQRRLLVDGVGRLVGHRVEGRPQPRPDRRRVDVGRVAVDDHGHRHRGDGVEVVDHGLDRVVVHLRGDRLLLDLDDDRLRIVVAGHDRVGRAAATSAGSRPVPGTPATRSRPPSSPSWNVGSVGRARFSPSRAITVAETVAASTSTTGSTSCGDTMLASHWRRQAEQTAAGVEDRLPGCVGIDRDPQLRGGGRQLAVQGHQPHRRGRQLVGVGRDGAVELGPLVAADGAACQLDVAHHVAAHRGVDAPGREQETRSPAVQGGDQPPAGPTAGGAHVPGRVSDCRRAGCPFLGGRTWLHRIAGHGQAL